MYILVWISNIMIVLLLLVILNYEIVFIQSARILAVFPIPSISHQFFFRQVTRELVSRGHEITVITTDPAFPKGQSPYNLTEIDIHDISHNLWSQHFVTSEVGKENTSLQKYEVGFKVLLNVFKHLITTKEVQDIILKKKGDYDALLLEAICPICLFFSHYFKVPVIQIGSSGRTHSNFKVFGVSSYPLLYPSRMSKKTHNFTKWEVVEQLYFDHMYKKYSESTLDLEEILSAISGTDVPNLSDLEKNIHMLLLNIHPLWVHNQALPPNIIQIQGLHKPLRGKISKELQTILDSSKRGIIYFSLGTNVKPSLLSNEKIQLFIAVFSKLPYDVIWKWDKDSLPETFKNINIFKWLPQPELLKHPNVKLFITQGGLQSTDEAINAAVPLLGIPMLGDQWYNVGNYVHHKIGAKLDLDSLTEEKLKNTIENIINNKSYRENIQRLRMLMEDQPQMPLERAVWWTEYVLRHRGADHLRNVAANLSLAEYYEIELIMIIISLSITGLYISINFLYLLTKTIKSKIGIQI